MKQKIAILSVVLITTLKLFAGAVSVPIASGTSVTAIQTAMSDAVAATNTDITLQFAKGGTWGSAAADLTIAVPAGVTKLTITSDPATTGALPLLYINTLTYADGLMTDGIVFDGVKVMTAIASRYLIQPSASTTTKIPAKITIKNCWVEGFRCVFSSTIATVTTELTLVNNIFKNLANEGVFRVSVGTVQKVTIRNNTFINVGGDASGTAGADYFIDFRSTNSVTSQINFSNNTIYYPRTQGRGLFRTSGNFTTGYLKENNNIYSTGNTASFTLQLLYNNLTAGTSTDTDSTNYFSSKMSLGSNKGSINTTVYTENSPSNLFLNASADDFTLNDPNFAGKNKAGDPRWFPKAVSNPAIVSTSVSPANAGTVTPSSVTVDAGTSVSLSATRNFGYQFKEWQDAAGNVLSTNATTSFNVVKDTSIIAVFDVIPTYNYTVNIAGSQWGTVSLSPAPTGGKYETGTVVSMTAVNDSVSTFLNWEDATTGKVRTITVDGDKTFTATFTATPFITGWDFKTGSPTTARVGDYYSDAANKGTLNIYDQSGSVTSWLANAGSFSPSTPCAYLWTSGATFATNRRYWQATFSTLGYTGIQVNSQMAGSYQHYLTQKMQVSLNGTDFTDVNSLDISTSNWANLNGTLPATYDNQATVYIRWVANTASTLVGNSSDNDGTAITNIFVYANPIGTQLNNNEVLNAFAAANANGQIMINSSLKNGKATIYTLVGQKLEELSLATSTTMSKKYNSGIYLVKFEEAGRVSTQKVIVK